MASFLLSRWLMWFDPGLLWSDGAGSVQTHPKHCWDAQRQAWRSPPLLPQQSWWSRRGVWQTGLFLYLTFFWPFYLLPFSLFSVYSIFIMLIQNYCQAILCNLYLWLFQRVMMQIVQELCKRPGLNKCGFDMPTIYIPNPNKVPSWQSVIVITCMSLFFMKCLYLSVYV